MRSNSRRQFIALSGSLAVFPWLTGCGSVRGRPLSVAAHLWPGYETLHLASQQHWLDERQVRLVETPSATSSLTTLGSGIVDAAALTLDEVLRARAAGLLLTTVLVFDISAGADVILGRPNMQSLANLKGRAVGVEQGGVGALLLRYALQSVGMSIDDVRQVPLTPAEQQDAWGRAELDAVVTYEPIASRLAAEGAVRLFDSRQTPQSIVDVLAVRSDVLASHATEVRHLLAAHFRALHFLRNNFRDAAELLAPRFKLLPDQVRPVFKGLDLPDLSANHRLLGGASPELIASARRVSGAMLAEGLLAGEDRLSMLVSAEYLPPEGRR